MISRANSFLFSPVEGRLSCRALVDLPGVLDHPFLRDIVSPIMSVFRGMVAVQTSTPQLTIEDADSARIDWVGSTAKGVTKVEFDVNSDGVAVRLCLGDAALYQTTRMVAESINYPALDRYLQTGDLSSLFTLSSS